VKPESDCAISRGGIGEIGIAVAAPRGRINRNKNGIGIRDWLGQIGGKVQPLGFHIGRNQFVESGS
jgi:hypothetical protein